MKREALRAPASVVAVMLLATGLFWLRWSQPTRQALPDTFWYTRQAVLFTGGTAAAAAEAGSNVVCRARNEQAAAVGRPPACRHYPKGWPDRRYLRIFTTRPGFPLLAAPLVALFGPWTGMALATLAGCLLVALLIYAALRQLGGSTAPALAGVVLIFALPSGYWMTKMMPDGAALASCLATGIGVLRLWRKRWWSGLAIATAGLGCAFLVKPADGFILAVVLLAASMLAAAWRLWFPDDAATMNDGDDHAPTASNGKPPQPAGTPTVFFWLAVGLSLALGLAGTLGWLVVSRAAHLPSFTYTIQDVASRHFRGRATRYPMTWLLIHDRTFWRNWLSAQVARPWAPILAAAGITGLVWRCRAAATPWLAVGLTGLLIIAAHPLNSQADRLILPIWLPVAIGIALLPWPRKRIHRVGTASSESQSGPLHGSLAGRLEA
ncbi:MAG: phospholipid carrier-dependent glycosyltransferase [Micromonosporaceae bacterium]